jgi:hypothetical protein
VPHIAYLPLIISLLLLGGGRGGRAPRAPLFSYSTAPGIFAIFFEVLPRM